MKRFWTQIFLFFLLGLVPILGVYLFFQAKGIQPLLTDSISFDAKAELLAEQPKEDLSILALGSSITLNNIGSKTLDKYLGEDYSYYNAASWGLTMSDLRLMLLPLLKKYNPELILLASGPMDFEQAKISICSENEFDQFINAAPNGYFFAKNTDIFSIIQRKKRTLELTEFASFRDRKHLLFDEWGGINLVTDKENFELERYNKSLIKVTNEEQYQELEKILELIKEHKTKLIFIASPMKKSPNCDDPICQEFISDHHEKVKTLVESKDQIFFNLHKIHNYPDSLFCDESHLIHKGPEQFSQDLINHVPLLELLRERKEKELTHTDNPITSHVSSL